MFYVISNGKCLFNTRRGEVGPRAHPHVPIAEHFTKGMSGRKEESKKRGEERETAIVIYAEVSEQLR